jgi:hypothetical protein
MQPVVTGSLWTSWPLTCSTTTDEAPHVQASARFAGPKKNVHAMVRSQARSPPPEQPKSTTALRRLTDEPHDRPWGIYSGYFRDLDGHLWEIIWNPRRVISDLYPTLALSQTRSRR